jgi:hypothetical protein
MDSNVPEFTDGQSIMSYDISIALLKKLLQKIEHIQGWNLALQTPNQLGLDHTICKSCFQWMGIRLPFEVAKRITFEEQVTDITSVGCKR